MRRGHLGLLGLLLAGPVVVGGTRAEPPAGYKLEKTVAIPGDGGWDYLSVDDAGRRVYVSHGKCVEVLDADSGELKGQVADTDGVHGIAVAASLGHGFTSNGKANTVSVFDLKTLKTIATVPTGKNPDAILYDPSTKRVFAFNGRSGDANVFEGKDGADAGTVALGGKPEFAASDGKGTIFVNVEDKSEIIPFDAKTLAIKAQPGTCDVYKSWSGSCARYGESSACRTPGRRRRQATDGAYPFQHVARHIAQGPRSLRRA